MINSVRNTVLAILNKNNYGYLSPSDFNLYSKQAQLDIFRDNFSQYNDAVNKENLRKSGVDFADTKVKTELDIENFLVKTDLSTINFGNRFPLPSLSTTNTEWFRIEKILCYNSVPPNRVLRNKAEKVSVGKITELLLSPLTAPSLLFPVYTVDGNFISVYPINQFVLPFKTDIECHYIRMPKDPKWTYVSLSGGEPMFDQTQSDYQDFELGPDDETMLVVKILQYAGVEIRETEVYAIGKKEQLEKQNQQVTQ